MNEVLEQAKGWKTIRKVAASVCVGVRRGMRKLSWVLFTFYILKEFGETQAYNLSKFHERSFKI